MTEINREHFQMLWHRKAKGETLSVPEQAELDIFVAQIEAEEAAYLAPANERHARESEVKWQRIVVLKDLLTRAETLKNHPPAGADKAQWEQERQEILQAVRVLSRSDFLHAI
jgi:hypothetical protein